MIPRRKFRVPGFTLVEVVITVAIAAVLSIATIGILTFCVRYQTLEQQRSAAVLAAQREIEQLRNRMYPSLEAQTRDITLDANRTPDDAGDDLSAVLELDLYHKDGSAFTAGERPSSTDRLVAEVTVTWSPSGNMNSRTFSESLMTILTP